MSFFVRRAEHKDAGGIIQAHRRSIRELCAADYTPEQIEAWAGRNFKEELWRATIDKDFVWVVSDASPAIYGFGHLQEKEGAAYIAGLYFVPELKGKGFGREIFSLMVAECQKRSLAKLKLHSTKTALAFYQHLGFQALGPETSIRLGGEAIPCYEMECPLLVRG